MTTTTSHYRRSASLAGLSLALISTCLLPSGVRAAGFSGAFSVANWSILNIGGGDPDQTLSGSGTPPQYTCLAINDVACAENIDASTGAVDVVGSILTQTGGGSAATPRSTTWSMTNIGQYSVLSFNWALATYTPGASNQKASYLIDGIETLLSSTDGDLGSLSNILLGPGQTLGFRVSTTDNTGEYGVLSISGFNTVNSLTSVPGPLPLAGGFAALGWSRRLRSRLRQLNG